ncbi:MAG: YtxH domain-containing protein [Brevibacterium yomogidense]|uniref:YtxH domain-containing protein n=1 Tax=Brevibacterium yomogidense TaxID=946573 RepID=A0A1X6XNE6_9MICO|nr:MULTISPECIES: hypothetical protein [Brevibacterium]SLN00884.1 hypothetical protein FM105_13745 [Brevibacterium yomogidense]SMX74426.1 hypothetical protein BSP109_01100 [Brevibacterium sp. Mu109]
MKKRLILLAGLGVGFVLGSYSGRSSYEKLRAQVDQLWSDPRVQEQFQKAGDTVREKAPEVAAGVQSAAADAVSAGREKISDLTHGDADEVPVDGADPDVVSDPSTDPEAEGPAPTV